MGDRTRTSQPAQIGCPAADVVAAIAAWAPRSPSAPSAAFAREAVAAALPATPARARALLFAAGRLAAFGEQVGPEPRAGVLLRASVIERFVVASLRPLSPVTLRTLRSNLRALARASEDHRQPAPVALPRERAKAPYGDAQIAGYLALAAAQSTEARRMHASALICLGAGAGLVGAELRHLTGADVVARSGGLLVLVGGRRARAVPVLAGLHDPLRQAAAFAAGGYLVGGRDAARRNLTDALTPRLCADAGLPRLEGGRLRASWLVACAQAIGLGAFMSAAGISCSQRLGDLAAQLPALAERDLVALLSGGVG